MPLPRYTAQAMVPRDRGIKLQPNIHTQKGVKIYKGTQPKLWYQEIEALNDRRSFTHKSV